MAGNVPGAKEMAGLRSASWRIIQPIKAKAETQTSISRLSARYSLAPM